MIIGRRAIPLSVLAVALIAVAVPSVASAGKAKPVKVVTRSASASTAVEAQVFGATARCPAKTTALSGGFDAPMGLTGPGHIFLIRESVRVGSNGWRVSGFAGASGGQTQTLTTYVYCARVKGKVLKSSETIALTAPGTDPSDTHAEAICPKKSQILSGGFAQTPRDTLRFVYASVATLNGWMAHSVSGTPTDGTLTAHAYCFRPSKQKSGKTKPKRLGASVAAKKKKKKAKLLANPTPLVPFRATAPIGGGSGARGSVTRRCGQGLKGVSGGFTQRPGLSSEFIAIPESARFAGGAWSHSAINFGLNPGTLIAKAYCGGVG